jgi:hypothetical protein
MAGKIGRQILPPSVNHAGRIGGRAGAANALFPTIATAYAICPLGTILASPGLVRLIGEQ